MTKLCNKYVDNDSPVDALDAVNKLVFDEMVTFEDGVPSGVMFSAMSASVQRMTELLGGMVIDLAQIVHRWSDAEAAEQEGMTNLALRLITADTLYEVLKAIRTEEDNGNP